MNNAKISILRWIRLVKTFTFISLVKKNQLNSYVKQRKVASSRLVNLHMTQVQFQEVNVWIWAFYV